VWRLARHSHGKNVIFKACIYMCEGCWWSLNINFDHQHCTKNGSKQHHSSGLCLQFTYFHLYLEIFAHAGKLYKKIKNQALEAIGARQGHNGPLGGVTQPHLALAVMANLPTTSLTHPKCKKHTPKPSPPLIPSQCKIKGWKCASHGLWKPPCLCRCSNGQRGFIPTLYYTSRGPTPKGKGHSSMSVRPTPCPVARRSTSTKPTHFWSRARRHQMEQRGASVWGSSLVVWSKGNDGMSHGLMTWQWSSPYSTLDYK